MKLSLNGVDLEVDATVTPGESMILYGPNSRPGTDPTVEIHGVEYNGNDVFELMDGFNLLAEVERAYIEKVTN